MRISLSTILQLACFITPSLILADTIIRVDPSDDGAFSSNLATCTSIADKFRKSCSSTDITNLKAGATTFTKKQVNCAGPYLCPDSSNDPICEWETAVCVYCEDISSVTYITIRTNALPYDCYQIVNGNPQAQSISFKVKFSPLPIRDSETTIRQNNTEIDTQTSLDLQLCNSDMASDGSIPSESGYTNLGTANNKIVGVALNGIPFYSGTSEQGYDAIFPKAYGNKQDPQPVDLDACLGSSQYTRTYHYYMFSPCIVITDEPVNATMCDDIAACKKSIRNYALSTWQDNRELLIDVVGVAKDGHMIVGPYKNDKKLWQPCDVDICNGVQFQTQYVYALTMFYPYTIGCWGPAQEGFNNRPSCTSNPRKCSNGNYLTLGSKLLISIVLSFILLIQ